MGRTRLI